MLAHVKAPNKTTAKYPLTRVGVKALPKRIIIGFVENKSSNGDNTMNSFNFKNVNIKFLCLYIDGVQVPSKPPQPNFLKALYIDSYHSLFSGCGVHFLNDGNDIAKGDYQTF